jgi:hypothetical protein
MYRRLALLLGLALAAGVLGCRSANKGIVESELAARESDVRLLKDELDRSEKLNFDLVRELQALRGQPGPLGLIERPTVPYPVQSIQLGNLTSGRHNPSLAGDDGLEVLIEIRDREDQPLKVPGDMVIEALEINPEGLKLPLTVWRVCAADLRGKWKQGLFNTGYLIELTFPADGLPRQEKIRVIVRFTMVDGRTFEAEKDIRVRVIPEANRPKGILPPTKAPVVPATPTAEPPTLPTPMPVPSLTPQVPPPVEPPILPPPTLSPPLSVPTLPVPSPVPEPTGPVLPARLLKPTPWQEDSNGI